MPQGLQKRYNEAKELDNYMKFKVLFIIWTSIFCLAVNNCCVSSDSDKVIEGLKKWEKTIPLPYHDGLEKTINLFASKSLSDNFVTYSAMIDTALMHRNMPLELKYLPLALSGMRRNYCQGDRCGVWQLPTLTALHYGLTIDDNQDERLNVEASTRAALDCLNELYQQYGDWWYSILAYTNSPIALQHALTRHGSTPPARLNCGTSVTATSCPTPKSLATSSPASTWATKANSSSSPCPNLKSRSFRQHKLKSLPRWLSLSKNRLLSLAKDRLKL